MIEVRQQINQCNDIFCMDAGERMSENEIFTFFQQENTERLVDGTVHCLSLGGFELGQSASGDELRHWLLMVKSPGQWIEMWHRLKPEHYNSFLRQRDSQTSR